MKKVLLTSVALLAMSVTAVRAHQPFEATAVTTDTGPAVTVTAGGPNLFDFLDSLVNAQGDFQAIHNRPFSANMTFLGVGNAITFATNNTGTAATLTLAPIGFTRTFTGANSQAVNDQIEDFFKKDGATTIAAFLKAIAKTSPIAVTDGNPNASTAVAANAVFASQGFTSADEFGGEFSPDDAAATGADAKPRFGGIALGMNAGKFSAGGFDGTMYDFSVTPLNFGNDTVRLLMPVDFNYLKLDAGSEVAGAGINFALPIRVSQMSKTNPWNWRITPLAGINVRGSLDLASLSPLWQAGIISTVDYKAAPKLVVSMVNQFTMHKSFSVKYDDLDFDPEIDQQILKNGFRFVTPLTRRVIADAFIVNTRFLKDAAVKDFMSYGASLAFRVTRSWNFVLGGNYDNGKNFKAYSVGLSSAWKW